MFPPEKSLLVTAFARSVHAIDRATGAVRWSVLPFGASETGSDVEIAIADGVVIAASEAALSFIDYATGHVHATVPLPAGHPTRPTMIVEAPHIYVSGYKAVWCYTVRGQYVWTRAFPDLEASSIALGVPGNVRQADDRGAR